MRNTIKLYLNPRILELITVCVYYRPIYPQKTNEKYFRTHINVHSSSPIRKTCPCKVYPLEPHFYVAKLGYAGVYLVFLFLLQNIDCGYSLEHVPTIYVLSKNKKNIKKFLLKIFIFYNFKNTCILHGRVFVMHSGNQVHSGVGCVA